ncbi:MAG: hypothetical protein CVT64_02370 [Actinobacteria bacterium HGW-Actinobacteria-4]|nr:MAG: hypothetical protein CVT64_02370 [Actinobacteria bacterium HGW-Actinobacteria-4]
MSHDNHPPSGNPGFVEDPREPWMNMPSPAASPTPATPGYSVQPTVPASLTVPGLVSTKKNWMGVVSLVFGVLGGGVIGLVLGIMGLNAAKRGEATNRGVALAGVIINSVILGLLALVFVVVGAMAVVGPQRTDTLSVGYCFDEPDVYMEDGIEVVGEYTLTPCDQPHYGEVYYVGTMTDAIYPGTDAVDTRVDQICYTQAEYWLDLDNPNAQYYSYYYPTARGFADGARQYECFVFADHDIAGSVRLNP